MGSSRLIDSQDRRLSYLRISITDRCNLRCIYCTPDGVFKKLKHGDILKYEEILRLVKIGVFLGIKKIRITGGEPLTRKGVCDFIRHLSYVDGLYDLSLTTNGLLLLEKAEKIKMSGISRINVSLDSLNSKKYKYITSHDEFERVWEGILFAHELGFSPIKINVVAMKGLNDDEIIDFARLTYMYPFHIRFIEYMPIGMNRIKSECKILTPEIKDVLSGLGQLRSIKSGENDGPARRFKFDGAMGEIGFISALSHQFCDKCNRLRLTANGEIRSCLLSDNTVSLKNLIRRGCSDDDLVKALIDSARYKGARHSISLNEGESVKGQMCSIGG